MGIEGFSSKTMTKRLEEVDKNVTQGLLNQQNAADCLQIAAAAGKALKQIAESYKASSFKLEEKNISQLSKLAFDLHRSKLEAMRNKENDEEYAKVAKAIEHSLSEALSVLYPEAEKRSLEVGRVVFEEMVEAILSDVAEEVVGQERLPGVMLKIIRKNLFYKYGIKPSREVAAAAATLYPLALLTASFDPRAKIPGEANQQRHLDRDEKQFNFEYKGQFGQFCSDFWTSQIFVSCLKDVWEMKRASNDAVE